MPRGHNTTDLLKISTCNTKYWQNTPPGLNKYPNCLHLIAILLTLQWNIFAVLWDFGLSIEIGKQQIQDLKKSSKTFGTYPETFVGPSYNLWTIFGNLQIVVGNLQIVVRNLQKTDENVVLSMFKQELRVIHSSLLIWSFYSLVQINISISSWTLEEDWIQSYPHVLFSIFVLSYCKY